MGILLYDRSCSRASNLVIFYFRNGTEILMNEKLKYTPELLNSKQRNISIRFICFPF